MSCLFAACLTIGLAANSYTTLEPTYAIDFKAGNDRYIWLKFEEATPRILGQGIADVDMYSFGVGAKYDFDPFFGFVEAGYAVMHVSVNQSIMDEIIYTALVNNHAVRPIPAGDPSHNPDAHTSYELGNGYIGRIGVGYKFDAMQVTVGYRFLSVREHYELWSQTNRDKGLGWWQESHGRDLTAFEVGISWTF